MIIQATYFIPAKRYFLGLFFKYYCKKNVLIRKWEAELLKKMDETEKNPTYLFFTLSLAGKRVTVHRLDNYEYRTW
jgi:hypothetical protein